MTNNLRQAAELALEALVKVDQAFLDTEGNYGQMETEAYNAACDAQELLRQALAERHECETCANKRQRLLDAGFLKSPLRRGVEK